MTLELYAALVLAAVLSWLLGALVSRPFPWSRRLPTASNHRGADLPVSLGISLVLAVIVAAWLNGFPGPWSVGAGLLLIAFAGFVDDWRGSEARGIRAHLGSLARGRLTTGILKILAGFAGGLLAVLALGGSPSRQLVGLVVIASAANLGNVLDVAPGRALKFFIPLIALLLAVAWPAPHVPLLAAALGAAVGLLWFDLRERAMLGDAGSNPLGFLVGVGLYLVLPTVGLGVALVAILGLQLVAETITLSRVIRAVPPLRWYDGLGRLPGEKSRATSPPAP